MFRPIADLARDGAAMLSFTFDGRADDGPRGRHRRRGAARRRRRRLPQDAGLRRAARRPIA